MRPERNELDALGAAVARETGAAVDAVVSQARRQRLATRPRVKRPLVFFGGALATACALVLLFTLRSSHEPLTVAIDATPLSTQTWVDSTQRQTVLSFSDASTVALEAGSLARVEQLSTRGAVVHLSRGTLTASITHRDDTQWQFEVGPYRVKVTGTKFTARWDEAAERFEVDMLEGSVEVEGPRMSRRRLSAGEHLQLEPEPLAPPALEAPSQALPDAGTLSVSPAAVRPAPVKPPSKVRAAEPAWLEAVRSGDYERAARSAEALGVKRLCEQEPIDRLMLLSDALRFAGRRADASSCYLAARRRFPASASAALAAFELGVMSAPAIDAVPWFETYLAEAPKGPLAAQALGRILEVQHGAHAPAAAATAKRYLEVWPEGPHAALARLLAR